MGRNDEYMDQVYFTYYLLLTTIYYILTTITIKRAMGFSPDKDKILKSFNPTNPSSDILLSVLCAFFVNSVVNI